MSGGTNSSGSRGVARISREQVLCLFRMLEAADLTLQQAQVLIDSGVFSMALRAALNDPEWLRREKTREELYPVVRVNGGVQVRDASELRVGSTGPQHLRLIRLVDDAKLTHNAAEALIDSRVLAIVIDAVQRDPTRLMQEEVKRGLVSPLGLDRHWIDCDVRPVVPIGLKYHDEDQLQSRVRGKFLWYKTKVGLWLSEGQSLGTVEGFAILEEINRLLVPVYPVQVLDFLLKNDDQIPEDWKGQATYFWSPYRLIDQNLCIRCLYWGSESWRWCYRWLGHMWTNGAPAAVPTSFLQAA